MRFLKSNKKKIVFIAVILLVLALAFSFGGNNVTEKKSEKEKVVQSMPLDTKINEEPAIEEAEPTSEEKEETAVKVTEEKELHEEEKTDVIPEIAVVKDEVVTETAEKTDVSKPVEARPQKVESGDLKVFFEKNEEPPQPEKEKIAADNPSADKTDKKELSCTLTIRCDTLLENLDMLEESKWTLVPKDGVILAEKRVVFQDGESVFDVLLRETRLNSIHMEYVDTPMYDSAYIEGIHNLYEFDCGELSGWIYRVNGWKPNYGCSLYALKDGDRIEWLYTCELGKDLE